jgi:DNA-binding MarR family transcriptional regulator
LVKLERDGQDARSRLVMISPAGQARLATIQKGFGPVFSQLLGEWSAEDLEQIIAGFSRLNAKMDEMRQGDEQVVRVSSHV